MPKAKKSKHNSHDYSSPSNPPKACLYFRAHNQESEEFMFIAQPFGSIESAAYWLDELTLLDEELTVKRSDKRETVLIRHTNGKTLTILGVTDEIYTFSSFTNTYDPKPKEQSTLNKLKAFYKEAKIPKPAKPTKITKTEPKLTKPKTKPVEGMITVAEMASSIDLPANKARQILRKAGIQKPDHGWSYKDGSKEAKKIMKLLKQ